MPEKNNNKEDDLKKNKKDKDALLGSLVLIVFIFFWIVFNFLGSLILTLISVVILQIIEKKVKNIEKLIPVGIGIFIVLILLAVFISEIKHEEDRNNQVASRCLDVSIETLSWVESNLVADDLSLENAQAVQSNDFSEVYFISAYLKGEGLSGNSIATFATNNIEGSGLILAVNAHAKEFSDWFHGDKEGAQYHVTISNDGARESRDCVSQ